MPFWNESGLVYCVSDGLIQHNYGEGSLSMDKWSIRFIGCGWSVPNFDVVRNPFIKGRSLYFSGCIVTDDEPISFDVFKIDRDDAMRRVGRNPIGVPVKDKITPPGTTVLRAIPCNDRSMPDSIILTVLDKGRVRSFLYSDKDKLARLIVHNGDDVVYPTIYEGEMVHVTVENNTTFLVRSDFTIL